MTKEYEKVDPKLVAELNQRLRKKMEQVKWDYKRKGAKSWLRAKELIVGKTKDR